MPITNIEKRYDWLTHLKYKDDSKELLISMEPDYLNQIFHVSLELSRQDGANKDEMYIEIQDIDHIIDALKDFKKTLELNKII